MDRHGQRDALAALLVSAGNWQAVYAYQPVSLNGLSPVATIHAGPLRWAREAAGQETVVEAVLIVTNLVRRDLAADAAEDALDTLLAALLGVVAANDTGTKWDDLYVESPTAPDYYVVDGIQYRAEAVQVVAVVHE